MSGYSYAETTTSGSITALDGTVTIRCAGQGGVSVVLTGTWVATIVPEVSVDGTTYVATRFINSSTQAIGTSVTDNGTYHVVNISGMYDVRVRASVYTSGTISVSMRGSEASVLTADAALTISATDLDIRNLSSASDSVAATQSGTWTVQPGNTANTTAWLITGTGGTFPVTGTFWQATQPISAAALPLPTGAATATLQGGGLPSALGVGGGLKVDGSGTALPASITSLDQYVPIDLDTGGGLLNALPVTLRTTSGAGGPTEFGKAADPLRTDPTGTTTQPVSGTVTANPATAAGKTLTYVSVAQGAAGTTELATASVGNKHKIVGAVLTMSAAGTLKFTDGVGDLTGAMDIAASGGFVLPTSILPYQQTAATNRALNLVTTLGAARGVVIIVTEA